MPKHLNGAHKRPVPELKEFLRALRKHGERERFLRQLNTSINYLYQLSCGDRRASADFAIRCEAESKKLAARINGLRPVLREHLRPDLWGAQG